MYCSVTVWLDVDIDNVDVDWRSEEIVSSDDTSDSSDNEEQLAEPSLDEEDELDNELDDNEYLEVNLKLLSSETKRVFICLMWTDHYFFFYIWMENRARYTEQTFASITHSKIMGCM